VTLSCTNAAPVGGKTDESFLNESPGLRPDARKGCAQFCGGDLEIPTRVASWDRARQDSEPATPGLEG